MYSVITCAVHSYTISGGVAVLALFPAAPPRWQQLSAGVELLLLGLVVMAEAGGGGGGGGGGGYCCCCRICCCFYCVKLGLQLLYLQAVVTGKN